MRQRLEAFGTGRLDVRRIQEQGMTMAEFDLVVRGGEVATGFGTTRCDIGVKDGRIVALGEKLSDGARVVDAGRFFLRARQHLFHAGLFLHE